MSTVEMRTTSTHWTMSTGQGHHMQSHLYRWHRHPPVDSPWSSDTWRIHHCWHISDYTSYQQQCIHWYLKELVYKQKENEHEPLYNTFISKHTFTRRSILPQRVPIFTTTCESSFSIGTHLRTVVHVQQTLVDICTHHQQLQSLIWSLYPTHHTPTSTTSTIFFQFKSISTVTLVGPSRVVTKLRTVVLESDTLIEVYKDMNILSSFDGFLHCPTIL